MANASIIPRRALGVLESAMTDTPVVAINGPRQVGKSTLAGELHRMRGGVVITLSAQTHTVRPGQTEGTSRT